MLCSRRRRREWRTEYSDSLLHFSAGCLLFLYQVQRELEHSFLKLEVVPDVFELLFHVLSVMSQVLVWQLKTSCSSQHYTVVLCLKWSHRNTKWQLNVSVLALNRLKSLHMNSDFCFNIRQPRKSGNIFSGWLRSGSNSQHHWKFLFIAMWEDGRKQGSFHYHYASAHQSVVLLLVNERHFKWWSEVDCSYLLYSIQHCLHYSYCHWTSYLYCPGNLFQAFERVTSERAHWLLLWLSF